MNNQEDNKINIKDKILTDINCGKISMRPRLEFTMRFVALVVLASSILLLSIFILNFLAFSIRVSHHESLLGFGARGIFSFLLIFPWMLLALDIVLILALEWLVRKFEFGYKMPVLYLLGGLFTITIVSGLLVDRGTPFNDHMLAKSQSVPLPLGFYQHAKIVPPQGSGVCFCTVVSVEGNKIVVYDNRSEDNEEDTLTVFFPEDNNFENITTTLKVGNTVLLAGDEKDGVVQAFGIQNIQIQPGY